MSTKYDYDVDAGQLPKRINPYDQTTFQQCYAELAMVTYDSGPLTAQQVSNCVLTMAAADIDLYDAWYGWLS